MQCRMSEIHLRQRELHGQIRIMGEKALIGQEEGLSEVYKDKSRNAMLVL